MACQVVPRRNLRSVKGVRSGQRLSMGNKQYTVQALSQGRRGVKRERQEGEKKEPAED